VVGCGLLIGRNGKLSLFFTLNGILLGKFHRDVFEENYNFTGRQMPTEHNQELFPTVTIWDMTLEANFGDDLAAKSFKYDIGTCPGLDLM
jgi:hypothetical protein